MWTAQDAAPLHSSSAPLTIVSFLTSVPERATGHKEKSADTESRSCPNRVRFGESARGACSLLANDFLTKRRTKRPSPVAKAGRLTFRRQALAGSGRKSRSKMFD